MSRRAVYPLLAAACALPRLGVLLHEGGAILGAGVEKSDDFARVFLANGTYGLLPGEPSAYTQPLYGWFLIPVYWIFGRSWESIGLSQIALAVATAWLVYEIGRRVVGRTAGIAAALIATLNPYLVWHDVHVNREIVDQLVAAALVLLTLVIAQRPRLRTAAGLGVVTGLAMLGNTRLVFLPVLCAAYLLWRLPRTRASAAIAGLVLAGAAVAVAPWVIRNKVNVGCFALTTDSRSLWKANNPQTYDLLTSDRWIDNVRRDSPRPPEPGRLTPQEARGVYLRTHGQKKLHPDECLAMSFYESQVLDFWRHHPGEKVKLMGVSEQLLWQPTVIETNAGGGAQLDLGRRVAEPAYMIALYALGALGLLLAPRAFAALVVLLLAYQAGCAAAFVGATRYRVAWDFLIALAAAVALARAAEWAVERRRRGEPAPTT